MLYDRNGMTAATGRRKRSEVAKLRLAVKMLVTA